MPSFERRVWSGATRFRSPFERRRRQFIWRRFTGMYPLREIFMDHEKRRISMQVTESPTKVTIPSEYGDTNPPNRGAFFHQKLTVYIQNREDFGSEGNQLIYVYGMKRSGN